VSGTALRQRRQLGRPAGDPLEGAEQRRRVGGHRRLLGERAARQQRDLLDAVGGDDLEIDAVGARHHDGADADVDDVEGAGGERLDQRRPGLEPRRRQRQPGRLVPMLALEDEELRHRQDRKIGDFERGRLGMGAITGDRGEQGEADDAAAARRCRSHPPTPLGSPTAMTRHPRRTRTDAATPAVC
jgi:hypothetical protein